MGTPSVIEFKGTKPNWGAGFQAGEGVAVIGRVKLGEGVKIGSWSALRGDGHFIDIGDNCVFMDRSTVHIADGVFPTKMGRNIYVGRYALVHACTIGDNCILGDAAVVMDNSHVGEGAVIAAGSLVPPGKNLDGGWLYEGSPAKPVRKIAANELEGLRKGLLVEDGDTPVNLRGELPPLDMSLFLNQASGGGPLYSLGSKSPQIDPKGYVAPTAAVIGDVRTSVGTSVWFSTVMLGAGTSITLGKNSNVQDNSILMASADCGPISIGQEVTVGHNVRMGSCQIGDHCLIGMGSEICDNVVVEDGAIVGARAFVESGTIVKEGYVWAGRPASEFRPVKSEELAYFQRGTDVYVGYSKTYLEEQSANSS